MNEGDYYFFPPEVKNEYTEKGHDIVNMNNITHYKHESRLEPQVQARLNINGTRMLWLSIGLRLSNTALLSSSTSAPQPTLS